MKKYLKFYEECMVTGLMPCKGLCSSFMNDSFEPDLLLRLFTPYDGFSLAYWGYDGDDSCYSLTDEQKYEFTEFRQTVVLFLAAMNDEL